MIRYWYYAFIGTAVAALFGLWLTTSYLSKSPIIENERNVSELAHFSAVCPNQILTPALSRQASATVMSWPHGTIYIGDFKQAWIWIRQNWRFQAAGKAIQGQTMGEAISQAFLKNHLIGRGVLSARLTTTGWTYEVAWTLRGRCRSFYIYTESPDLVKLILLKSLRSEVRAESRVAVATP